MNRLVPECPTSRMQSSGLFLSAPRVVFRLSYPRSPQHNRMIPRIVVANLFTDVPSVPVVGTNHDQFRQRESLPLEKQASADHFGLEISASHQESTYLPYSQKGPLLIHACPSNLRFDEM